MRILIYIGFAQMILLSCVSGGTHGSIKSYVFQISKYDLEKIIDTVVSRNHNIIPDNNKGEL
jgi:hypothetical protein